jgi:hypothetical protein
MDSLFVSAFYGLVVGFIIFAVIQVIDKYFKS